jgi:hypothetical protein
MLCDQPQSELKEPALMKNIKSRDSALAGMKMLTVAGIKTTGGTGERQMPVKRHRGSRVTPSGMIHTKELARREEAPG